MVEEVGRQWNCTHVVPSVEALLDGGTSVYRKGTDPLRQKIQNLVDTWNNWWNAQQYFEKVHLPWVAKYQGRSKDEYQDISEYEGIYSDSDNNRKSSLYFSSSSGSIEMYQSPRKNREVPKMVGVSRQNIVGANPLETTPVQDGTMPYEYLKIRREGGTLHGRHLCSYY